MEERKLTPEQIDNLYKFCEDLGIKYYDLQIELVDHLGSAIENQWEQKSNLSFQEALNQTYKAFGDKGFKTFRKKKEKALREKYSRLHRLYMRDFYCMPRIIKTIIFALAVFTAFRFSNNDNYVFFLLLAIYFLFVLYQLVFSPNKLIYKQIPQKSFMLFRISLMMKLSAIVILLLPLNLGNIIRDDIKFSDLLMENNLSLELFWTILFTVSGVAILVLTKYIPHRIKEDFDNEFPQFITS